MFRGSPGYLGGSPRIEPIDDWAMRHSSPSQKLNAGGRLIINHRQAIMFLWILLTRFFSSLVRYCFWCIFGSFKEVLLFMGRKMERNPWCCYVLWSLCNNCTAGFFSYNYSFVICTLGSFEASFINKELFPKSSLGCTNPSCFVSCVTLVWVLVTVAAAGG